MSVYETKPTQKNQLPKSLLPYALKSDAINKMTFASLSQGFIKEGLKCINYTWACFFSSHMEYIFT